MSNAANTGNLIGRLAADPRVFSNADGSKKVAFALYIDRAYKTRDGKTITDQVSVEAFVNNQVDGLGPYTNVHKGDLVALNTHIEQVPYEDKAGKTVYPAAKIAVDSITYLESRTTTQARLAKRVVSEDDNKQAAPAADAAVTTEGENTYENDTPFANAG